jgi:hypothetical protein
MKGRCQGWTLQLVKWRVARSGKEGQPSLTFKSRRIAQGRNESSTFELTKVRVARGASVKPSRWSRRKALTEEEPYPYRHFGYREIGKEESGAISTHELASCELRQAPLGLALVIALWSLGEKESSRLVLFAQGSFRKDLWIDNL